MPLGMHGRRNRFARRWWSDSTLRLAETVGLRADVLCMSGGGVGHLANAVRDDPAMSEMGMVTVITGGNDYIGAKYENNNEFVFNVDNSVEKLKGIFWGDTGQVLFPFYILEDDAAERALPPDSGAVGRDTSSRSYARSRPLRLAVVPILVHEVDTDGRGHPTVEGTMTILKGLSKRLPEDPLLQRRAGDLQVPLRRGPGGVPLWLPDLRRQGGEVFQLRWRSVPLVGRRWRPTTGR